MNQVYTTSTLRTIIGTLVIMLTSTMMIAQTVWTGTADTEFSNADNWSNGLPANGNNAIIPGGSVVIISSNLDANYDIASFGSIQVSGATVTARGNLSNSGSLSTDSRINVFGKFENFGDLELSTSASLFTAAGGNTRSNGFINNEGWIGAKGDLINEGTIEVTSDGGLAIYETGTLSNPGVVNISGFYNNRNGGNYSSPSGGTINVEDGGRLNNYSAATIRNAGIINVNEGGLFLQRANLLNVPGRIFIFGTLKTNEEGVTRSNFLTVEDGGLLDASSSDTFQIVFSLVNNGRAVLGTKAEVGGLVENKTSGDFEVLSSGGLNFIAGTNLSNEGIFLNDGEIRTVGTLTNDGTFTNEGTIIQNNGGTIANNSLFTNKALIQNVNRIINNDQFVNESRLTNSSGGTIENNANFLNKVDAHVENLFEIYNKADLVNRGFFENGVSVFNEANFDNYGFLANVGDIFNNPAGIFNNKTSGVVDNSDAGIFTNEGVINNDGEINNFSCGVFVNNNLINNDSWITNEGIFYQNGTITNKPLMGNGPVVPQGGSSPLICQPWTQKVDQNGNTTVSGTRFASPRFDSCNALTYLINGEESQSFTCADIGVHQITLTLVDRRGNEINCGTTLTITDEFAPRIDSCPADILLSDVAANQLPIAATWVAPSFVDNCDNDLDVVASHQPGDLFPEGSTVVSYIATDDAGNEFVCEFTVRVELKQSCTPKNSDGLLAYYNLKSPSDRWVYDRSGYGEPVHLENKNTRDIKRDGDCGYKGNGHGIIKSWGAGKISRGIMMTNALTVEAWVIAADKHQDGPARIATISENTGARNFTLGQENGKYIFRLKTTHTNGNGLPNRQSSSNAVKPGQEQHLVFTRDADGNERFYIDGDLQYSGQVGGNLSNWGQHCSLAFFNEMTNNRGWKGTLKKVSIYDRAWSASEVVVNQSLGACCSDGDDSPLGDVCEGERGKVTYERYENIGGVDLPWLFKAAKFPAQPDVTEKLTKLKIPSRVGDNYGSRTRGWIYPSKTGDYQFAISGDDHTRLLLSRNPGEAGYAYVVARINGYTNPGQLHKYSSQKSGVFHLQAGKAYYFELLHKEAGGGDHAAVYWKQPDNNNFALIGSNFIGDIESCGNGDGDNSDDCVSPKGGLLREVWNGINSNDIWALMQDPRYPNNPDSRGLIHAYCGPLNVADHYGTRVRGYIHPDVSGEYKFTLTGDNQTKLMLSTDASPDNAFPIAEVNGWTGPREFHKFQSQKSVSIYLEAGKRYYTELIHQEGNGGDFFNVFWQTPTNNTRVIVPGANLSPYVDCDGNNQPSVCNTSVLFVVGNTHLNNGDAAVKHRLEYLGYDVMVKDPQWASADMAADKGLVIISSTVNSGDLGAKFRDVSTPVMTWESWLYDDMRMTGTMRGQDYGNSHSRKLIVVNGSDQLAAGKQGHQNVYTTERGVRYGKVMNSEARIIANAPADPWMAAVFAYDAGAQMAGGMRAPGIRIGFYLDNDGAANWSNYGQQLFDAAVRYATNCTGSETARRNPEVLTLDARQQTASVKLNWTSNTAFKNDHFLVERSADDVTYFVIDEVAASGQGEDMVGYEYLDVAPMAGENFYRITAVYTDGNDRQSELRLVSFTDLGSIAMFPNPASDNVTVLLDGFSDTIVSMTISDALGRTISTRILEVGSAATSIDVSNVPSGWYGVTFRSGGVTTTKALMINRD